MRGKGSHPSRQENDTERNFKGYSTIQQIGFSKSISIKYIDSLFLFPAQKVPPNHRATFPEVFSRLLEEVTLDYEESLREGTVNMMIRNPDLEAAIREKEKLAQV